MANPWDDAPIIEAAKPATPAKKAGPRQYSPEAAKAALVKSDAVMNEGLKKLSAPQRKKALANYYASPTIRRLRENAGLPAVRTREEELQSIAAAEFKKASTRPVTVRRGASKDAGFFTRRRQATPEEKRQLAGVPEGRTARVTDNMGLEAASTNAFGRALFGLPERVLAAIAPPEGTRNYDESLKVTRKVNDLQRKRSLTGNVVGTVGGAVAGGIGAGGLVRLAGRGVAVLPGGQATGNFIQNLTRLETGRRGANAAKIVTAGAAGGGAQAAGEGTDVATGTAFGAVAAPLVVGGFKGAEWATRPVRDFLRASSAKNILGRQISMTAEELQDAATAFRRRTGREPTVFEILPSADRKAVTDMVRKMPAASRENVAENVRARVASMPDELAGRTRELTAAQQRFIAQNIARDLAASRGAPGAPTADEIALAQRATRDPTEMEQVRRTVNQNIMGPFDNQRAYESVNDLIPTIPVNAGNGRITTEIADEQMAATIRGAAGSLRLRDEIRVQDVTRLLSRLRGTADRGGVEGDAAQNAINHIEDIMARDHPGVADAMARMNAAHASRSRMLEAVPEGRATRLREDVPVTTGRAARGVRQSYDTPEGAAGRAVGQRAELLTDFAGTPGQAAARAGQIADSPGTQEAIRRNLGADVGDDITQAASAQAESLRRLSALRQPVKGDEADMDFGDLAMTMSLLSPTSLVRTKSQAVGTLLRLINGIPEGRANQIVEALFSRNPGAMAQATRLLTSAGDNARRALRDIVASVAIGAQSGAAVAGIDAERSAPGTETASIDDPAPVADAPINSDAPWESAPIAEEGDGQGMPYGRAALLSVYPDAVVTDDERDPDSGLGRANPGSNHVMTDGAVDVRPIPGMTFDEFIAGLEAEGLEIIEAIDEVNNPSGHATGPHWHVVFA